MVSIPKLLPQTEVYLYFGNEKAAPAANPKATYDAASAVYHFAEPEGTPQDSGLNGLHAVQSSAQRVAASFSDGGAGFNGSQSVTLPPVNASSGFSFAVWIKPSSLDGILIQSDGLRVVLEGGMVKVQAGASSLVSSMVLSADKWHHLGLTVSDALHVYVDGKPVGEGRGAALPTGGITLGSGFRGEMDEVQVSGVARTADWIAVQAAQGPDGKLVALGEDEAGEGGGEASHLGIILKSLTLDGWIAIGFLAIMLLIAIWVMYSKAIYITRVDESNGRFMGKFRELSTDLAMIDKAAGLAGEFEHSSLYRIYHIGAVELAHRFKDTEATHLDQSLSPQSLDAIRATLDAGLVEEIQRMNKFMVLLTIAISGGPFIGLLGTVMGVMITFAAIAAAGDVNVNAIAPGIAAALMATVAGMSVAIPSLFGYNYLASRIKSIVSQMHIFVDEFITKLAENYSR
jgi:biopolymer transport protein ExbB